MSKEPTDNSPKKSSTKLPDTLPEGFVDRTAEALGTTFGIVGIGRPSTNKPKPSE